MSFGKGDEVCMIWQDEQFDRGGQKIKPSVFAFVTVSPAGVATLERNGQASLCRIEGLRAATDTDK
jgi:hypothetical protein